MLLTFFIHLILLFQTRASSYECEDTDTNGVTDANGLSCSQLSTCDESTDTVGFSADLMCCSCGGGRRTEQICLILSDLYISEYGEGSSNNKFLEIYNPYETPINLFDIYGIGLVGNGGSGIHERVNDTRHTIKLLLLLSNNIH